jgi:hypothetical protein
VSFREEGTHIFDFAADVSCLIGEKPCSNEPHLQQTGRHERGNTSTGTECKVNPQVLRMAFAQDALHMSMKLPQKSGIKQARSATDVM